MKSVGTALRVVLGNARRGGPGTPGWWSTARLLLVVAATAAYVARRPGDDVVWLPAGILVVATAAERTLRRLLPRPLAAGLPGLVAPRVAAAPLVVPAALAALLLVVVAAAAALPTWLFPVAAVVQGVPLLVASAQALRAYAERPARAAELHRAVAALAPEFVLYTARRSGAYQVEMWLPHLKAVGRPFVVVTRDPEAVVALARVVDAPVVACPRWRDLDEVVVPTLRAAFYVNSVAANADFVTYRQLTHVYLGHGESDKALSHHPAHAMYDLVFVAGRAAVERYAHHGIQIPDTKFVVVGSPQSAGVDRAVSPGVAAPQEAAVLYAPTWQGYNDGSSYSSLGVGRQLVEELLRLPGSVVFRPHPFSRARPQERLLVDAIEALLAQDARDTGRPHVWGVDEPFSASANRAVAMVADLSSVVTEFLVSDKPLAIVTDGGADFRERNPVAHAAYLVEPRLGNLPTVLAQLLGPDPLREHRAAVRERYVGAEGTEAFERAVLALLDAPPRGGSPAPASR